jgi:peptidoglycan-associated lipoprotein
MTTSTLRNMAGIAIVALLLAACASKPKTTDMGANTATPSSSSSSSSSQGDGSSASGQTAPLEPMGTTSSGATPGSQEDMIAAVGSDRVFFDYDSDVLDATSQDKLRAQAAWLNKYPNVRLTIEGHCDERGTREYNLALGDRRAEAVRTYLASLGISEERLSTISYGKERPDAVGSDDESWARNRRGVSVVRGGATS